MPQQTCFCTNLINVLFLRRSSHSTLKQSAPTSAEAAELISAVNRPQRASGSPVNGRNLTQTYILRLIQNHFCLQSLHGLQMREGSRNQMCDSVVVQKPESKTKKKDKFCNLILWTYDCILKHNAVTFFGNIIFHFLNGTSNMIIFPETLSHLSLITEQTCIYWLKADVKTFLCLCKTL